MSNRILLGSFILLFILCFTQDAETKVLAQNTKNENKKPVTIYVFDKKANKLISEKGLIDNKGVVSTKCRTILKWFEEVENTLIVKTNDGEVFQLGKILSCNIKKDHTLFLLEPLNPEKNFLIKTEKPLAEIKAQSPAMEKTEKPAEAPRAYNVQDLFQEGIRYQELKDYNIAIDYYKQALMLKSDFAEAHMNLGTVYFVIGRYNEAVEYYENALKYSQDKGVSILSKIGTSYLMLGDYNKAIETYKQSLILKSDSPEIHFSLGLAYFMKGNNEEAFNEYISLKKMNVQLAENLFDLLYR